MFFFPKDVTETTRHIICHQRRVKNHAKYMKLEMFHALKALAQLHAARPKQTVIDFTRMLAESMLPPNSSELLIQAVAKEIYLSESRQAMAVAQLRGLYRSFGVTTRPAREPDHLSILCEFMSLLCAKESRAHNAGVQQRVDDCVAAQTIVIEDYLSFVPLLQKAVSAHARKEYYLWMAAMTVEFIALERELFLLSTGSHNR